MASRYVLLVDDQDWDVVSFLHELDERSRHSRALRHFLRGTTDLLQVSIAALSAVELRALGLCNGFHFETLLDLAKALQNDGTHMGALHSVLACACCIAELISRFEKRPLFSGIKVYVLGLGISALVAAAVAAAKNVVALSELGVETISVALRLCLELRLRSIQIEHVNQSWARTISGVSADKVSEYLDSYHRSVGTLVYKHVYVSEESSHWLTLSGPPSSLSDLMLSAPELRSAHSWNSFAHSALHAAHLCPLDVQDIVRTSPLLREPIISTICDALSSDWAPYLASDLQGLLEEICHKLAHESVKVPDVPETVLSSLLGVGAENIHIISIGATRRTEHVRQELEAHGFSAMEPMPTDDRSTLQQLREGSGSVAIVGMAGRFPGSDDVAGLWESLLAGKEFHEQVPEDRFDLEAWRDAVSDDSPLPYGCFLDRPGLFDRHLFNISPRESLQMDPNQRLLLTVSYEALQRAGYSPDGLLSTESSRIATYFGQTTDDWREVTMGRGIDLYYVPGLLRSFGPGRLHYHYKWEGPSYSIDSTCASSASAISLACSGLLARECDTALAGGVNSLSSPMLFAGLKKGGFLSPSGSCKTFRGDSDGYCRAEGVGVVVLKRLEDAMRENDNILAVVKSHARNHSANAVSITNPDVGAQSRLYAKALQMAGVRADQISYVEMHGTGTQAGDVAEVQAIVDAFCEGHRRHNPLVVGAMKASVGHAEAAAGVLSMIKSIMVLKTGRVPPQPGMPFGVNPKLALVGRSDIKIADGHLSLPQRLWQGQGRKVVLNNFDASGGNVCFILEEAPRDKKVRRVGIRSHHIVTVSGRTAFSLQENKRRLADHLEAFPEIDLEDLSYTTTGRSMHERLRASYVADSVAGVVAQLHAEILNSVQSSSMAPSNVAIVCTGTSAQYGGMGAALFRTNSRFRKSIMSMQKICDLQHIPNFLDIIAEPTVDIQSRTTTQSQLGTVALEIALADLWCSWGIQPAFVVGHSLGEYAALCIAGVLSAGDALTLVAMRGSLMEDRLSSGAFTMLAVGASAEDVAARLSRWPDHACTIACVNAPLSTVISGPTEEVQVLQQSFRTHRIRSTLLNVMHGFHSSQFDPIIADFATRAAAVQFLTPRIPVASTFLGAVVRDAGTFNAGYMAQQMRSPVRFIDAVNACTANELADGRTVWLEVGPEQVCTNFVKSILQTNLALPTISAKETNWKTIASSAAALYRAGVSIRFAEYHREYVDGLSLLELPTYGFDEKNFWNVYRRREAPSNVDRTPSAPASTYVPNLSLSLHHLQEERVTEQNTTVDFISRFADGQLFNAVHGHNIENAALCPGSVFADMAFTAAGYIQSRIWPEQRLTMELRNMIFEHPVVVPNDITNSNSISVHGSMHAGDGRMVDIAFTHNFHSSSERTGRCQVHFHDLGHSRQQLDMSAFFVHARMDSLIGTVMNGAGHRLQKPVLYKIFSNVVQYSPPFQAIDEVFWSEEYGEAVAEVTFQEHLGSDKAQYSPYWVDVLLHLPGFMLNANITTRDDVVYICEGVKSMHIVDDLATHKHYRCYARKQEDKGKGVSISDVYLFDGEKLVGVCHGIRFQRLPRAIFSRILQQRKDMSVVTSPLTQRMTDATTPKKLPQPKELVVSAPMQLFQRSAARPAGPSPRVELKGSENQTLFNLFMKVISDESGAALQDIKAATEFSDMGVDSLLGIAIVDRFRRFTGVELGANFFIENRAVQDAQGTLERLADADQTPEESLDANPAISRASSSSSNIPSVCIDSSAGAAWRAAHKSAMSTPPSEFAPVEEVNSTVAARLYADNKTTSLFTSKAVLIHGNVSRHRHALFLVADGAGSATAYLQLPRFTSDLPTYALESPFLHCPHEYQFAVEETAAMYIATIKRLQPHGPYMIGGWSAGGVHAYEVARQFLQAGDAVHCLIILDMHIPRPMPPGSKVTVAFIEKIGIATGLNRVQRSMDAATIKRLKQHLLHTIRSLSAYRPVPMPTSHHPTKTLVIWARKSLSEVFGDEELEGAARAGLQRETVGNVMQDPETDIAAWFFSKRNHFGANGWDDLVGDQVECHSVDSDHFSMVTPPAINVVGQLMEPVTAAP